VVVAAVVAEALLILMLLRSWETWLPMMGASFFRNNSV
jgi:hypothetical protein